MKRIRPLTRLAAGFAAALAVAAAGFAACAAPPVWHVKKAGAEITLFGSVHILSPTTDWKTPALAAELARADEVWFEIPFDAAAQAEGQAMAVRRMALPKGQTLSPLLPTVTQRRLARVQSTLGIPVGAFEGLKPWAAEVSIGAVYVQQKGARAGSGVEQQIANTAPSTAAFRAFETAEQQIGFFDNVPIKEQVASLGQSLKEIETEPDLFDRIVAAWVAGDARAVSRLAVLPIRKDAPGTYKRLVVDRNRRWTSTIEGLLDRPRRVFIVVGVGHLVGPDSVPALLRRKGVQVEGP